MSSTGVVLLEEDGGGGPGGGGPKRLILLLMILARGWTLASGGVEGMLNVKLLRGVVVNGGGWSAPGGVVGAVMGSCGGGEGSGGGRGGGGGGGCFGRGSIRGVGGGVAKYAFVTGVSGVGGRTCGKIENGGDVCGR